MLLYPVLRLARRAGRFSLTTQPYLISSTSALLLTSPRRRLRCVDTVPHATHFVSSIFFSITISPDMMIILLNIRWYRWRRRASAIPSKSIPIRFGVISGALTHLAIRHTPTLIGKSRCAGMRGSLSCRWLCLLPPVMVFLGHATTSSL